MSKELTKKAVEMLLRGATLVSDPCPYCNGVRIIKDGHALCVNCGREAKEEKIPAETEKIMPSTAIEKLNQKLRALTQELENEKNYEKQQNILKSISDIITVKEKLKNP